MVTPASSEISGLDFGLPTEKISQQLVSNSSNNDDDDIDNSNNKDNSEDGYDLIVMIMLIENMI